MRNRPLLTILLLLALALFAAPDAALAQPGGQNPNSLSSVKLIAEGVNQSIFELSFSPSVSGVSTVTSDPSRPGLSFNATVRGTSAVAPGALKGLVRSIDFEQNGQTLIIYFSTGAPSKVATAPGGDRRLLATISRLTGSEASSAGTGTSSSTDTGATYVPSGPLPRAVAPKKGEDGYEMIMLKYADVSEVVGLLTDGITVKSNDTFIRREPGFGSPATSGTSYSSSQAQAAQDDRPLGQSVDSSLSIDRRLNAVWIKGSPERIARLKAQIALIDVPVDSVILETQFVELTQAGARNIGIDFTNASGQIAVGTLQTGQFIPFGFDTNHLDSASLQAAIYAQVQSGEGRIVSKPRIAAQSGSTAKIITGDALPILTAITLSGVNGVSQQVQYVNVGVTLQIAPRVSADGFVTSHIYGVVSSVTGFSQGYPTISQREAETSASVRDGETFVIGGLSQENKIGSESRIPILGDIPLIGELFSLEKSTDSKTDLYIVITPHIVRHQSLDRQNGTGPTDTNLPPPLPLNAPDASQGMQ